MASKTRKFTCLICVQNVPSDEREKIYALGKCNHIVCYVCSARLRAICNQLECPTCRERLNTVVFTSVKKRSYEEYDISNYIYNEKYGIYFENKSIECAFNKLLKYDCQKCTRKLKNNNNTNNSNNASTETNDNCPPKGSSNSSRDSQRENIETPPCKSPSQTGIRVRKELRTSYNSREETKPVQYKENQEPDKRDHFNELPKLPNLKNISFDDVFGLKTHLDYVHRLKLCDLCLTHNKLFPFEYSYYDVNQLHKHKSEGEVNTSHRGHPMCRLCGDSFFNQDDLILHMSREHYYCHLCNHENERRYFNDYDGLRIHFKEEHFLCERDSCREERFTSVFANEIEYTIHMVHVHGPADGTLSRGESRQFRTIMLPGLPHARPSSSSYQGRQTNRRGDRHGGPSNGESGNNRQARDSRGSRDPRVTTAPANVSIVQQRLPTSADFPTLDGGSSSISANTHSNNTRTNNENRHSNDNNSSEGSSSANNQHSLDQRPSTSSGTSTLSQRVASGSSRNSFVRTATGSYGRAPRLDEQDFPPLPEAPKQTKKGNKEKKDTSATVNARNGFPDLDQLLTQSLAQAAKQQSTNKVGKNGNSKSHKQKPIKIQL